MVWLKSTVPQYENQAIQYNYYIDAFWAELLYFYNSSMEGKENSTEECKGISACK